MSVGHVTTCHESHTLAAVNAGIAGVACAVRGTAVLAVTVHALALERAVVHAARLGRLTQHLCEGRTGAHTNDKAGKENEPPHSQRHVSSSRSHAGAAIPWALPPRNMDVPLLSALVATSSVSIALFRMTLLSTAMLHGLVPMQRGLKGAGILEFLPTVTSAASWPSATAATASSRHKDRCAMG